MRFIVDESTGKVSIEYLRSVGYDVLAAAEIMRQAADLDALSRAVSERRILFTNDKDFGELVFRSGQPHHGIPLLRLRDESAANHVRVLQAVLEQYADNSPGAFTVATEDDVRVRPGSGAV
ncbi:MAG: DUF5615 family PIN-like protein [Chloroflexi bacterium]|nr:DUF5615 family PIN-like protein [Chloroflexota bacterium]